MTEKRKEFLEHLKKAREKENPVNEADLVFAALVGSNQLKQEDARKKKEAKENEENKVNER